MLQVRRGWAQRERLDPDFIERLYRDLVSYFIAREMEVGFDQALILPVVNPGAILAQVDHKFHGPVRQEALQLVGRSGALERPKDLHESGQRRPRSAHANLHSVHEIKLAAGSQAGVSSPDARKMFFR